MVLRVLSRTEFELFDRGQPEEHSLQRGCQTPLVTGDASQGAPTPGMTERPGRPSRPSSYVISTPSTEGWSRGAQTAQNTPPKGQQHMQLLAPRHGAVSPVLGTGTLITSPSFFSKGVR
ncbi:hypothetical protein Stsp01_64390 [Streptomyces sp. NBRC 13847]|nr:hypothetical protein Stsp01_64390 [Streptomyces sp. NBRC 13847]